MLCHESQYMSLEMWREEFSGENTCFDRSGDSDVQCYFDRMSHSSTSRSNWSLTWCAPLHYLSSEIREEGGRGETLQTHVQHLIGPRPDINKQFANTDTTLMQCWPRIWSRDPPLYQCWVMSPSCLDGSSISNDCVEHKLNTVSTWNIIRVKSLPI